MVAPDSFSVAIPPLISAVSGLAGVSIGGWIASHNQRQERRQCFIRDQLTEFYAPLLGMRERLRASGDVRLKVRNVARNEWPRLTEQARQGGTEQLRETEERLWPAFEGIIEDDNQQLKSVHVPLYRQMADLFTAKMHLAEPATRQHFGTLVEFVELWERCLRGALPAAVVNRIAPNEENLSAFYADLETNFARLQAALKE